MLSFPGVLSLGLLVVAAQTAGTNTISKLSNLVLKPLRAQD